VHGPNLPGSIRGLTAREAAGSQAGAYIWEIVFTLRMENTVTRRIVYVGKSAARFLFKEHWFLRPSIAPKKGMAAMSVARWRTSTLRAGRRGIQTEYLDRPARGSKTLRGD